MPCLLEDKVRNVSDFDGDYRNTQRTCETCGDCSLVLLLCKASMKFASLKGGYNHLCSEEKAQGRELGAYLSVVSPKMSILFEFLWRKKIMFSMGVSCPSA